MVGTSSSFERKITLGGQGVIWYMLRRLRDRIVGNPFEKVHHEWLHYPVCTPQYMESLFQCFKAEHSVVLHAGPKRVGFAFRIYCPEV